MDEKPDVFVIDDDRAMRDSLSLLLETAGYSVRVFDGAEAFLQACTPDCEGCLVLDMNMPGMGGLTLQKTLRQRNINLPAVFLTGYGTIPDAVKAMRGGAADFLTKPVNGKLLLDCVADALARSREMSGRSSEARAIASRLEQLTQRERQIVQMISEGRSSKEIGQALGISYRTVEVHRRHLMSKLGTASNLEVARLVFESEKTSAKHLPPEAPLDQPDPPSK
jgi:RNA polymerase sigma factor (sigma-70 family)